MSGAFDEVGYCTHWTLVAGDLLMYLALAHTVAGFFAPLETAIDLIAVKLPDQASEISFIHTASLVAGGVAWFLATYAGPVVSLVRSPFQRRTNIALGVAYLVVLLVLFWINSHAVRLEAAGSGDEAGLFMGVLRELVQPLRW
jgi:hypothetical protein